MLAALLLISGVGCRFNLAGYALKEPTAADLVGSYRLNLSHSEGRLRRMGYRSFGGEITLKADGSFAASDLPACCVHGWDETVYPFSGGYYSLSGTWKISKESDVYVVSLELAAARMTEPPVTSNPDVPRDAPSELKVNLIEGHPLDLGFPIFNGDFDDVVFARNSNKA